MCCPNCGDTEYGPWVPALGTPHHMWCEWCLDRLETPSEESPTNH